MAARGKNQAKRHAFWFSLAALLFLAGGFPLGTEAAEKGYPNRPINLIVPYAPGGAADLGSKIVAEKMSEFLGQPFVSVYKPGGGGSLGAAFVAKAKADGYTVLVGSSTPLVLSPIVKKMDYKLDDFAFMGIYGMTPIWLALKADAKWKSLKEFVEDAKKAPGSMTVCSYGKLTAADFVIEIFSKQAGVKLTHVPYKSTAEALSGVMGGHAQGAFVTGAGGLLESGTVRILAVAADQRLEGLPDVPTFKEMGYPVSLAASYTFSVPKVTSREVVDKLSAAQKKAFEKYGKEIKESLRRVELWAGYHTPEETMQQFKKEYEAIYKAAEEIGVVAK